MQTLSSVRVQTGAVLDEMPLGYAMAQLWLSVRKWVYAMDVSIRHQMSSTHFFLEGRAVRPVPPTTATALIH